ncbi:hypothetical protein ABLE91_09990 [Aquabacter sp. CN5-332]|uniref:hypothetical protein n=1 Tax=Aquabacter sp. CN5-332 TaxID=3156608 RepID=UPI0032B542FA
MRTFPSLRGFALGTALLVSACSHMPLASMARLSSFDPMRADLAALRAAVRMPSGIAPVPGGAGLALAYWREGEEDGRRMEAITLEEVKAPEDAASLVAEKGMAVAVFRIPPADLPRLEAIRAEIETARAEDQAGGRRPRGSLSVSMKGCVRGPVPDGPLPVTTYLKIAQGGDFIPLLRDVDLRSLKSPDGRMTAEPLQPCS